MKQNENIVQLKLKPKGSMKQQEFINLPLKFKFSIYEKFYSNNQKVIQVHQQLKKDDLSKKQEKQLNQSSLSIKDLPSNSQFWNYIERLDQTKAFQNTQDQNNYILEQCYFKLKKCDQHLGDFHKAKLFLSLLKVLKYIDFIPLNISNQDHLDISFEHEIQCEHIKINSLFQEFQFSQKVCFFFDFIDQFWSRFRKNMELNFSEQQKIQNIKREKEYQKNKPQRNNQQLSNKMIKFYIRKKRYELNQEFYINVKEFAKMFLRLFLIIDFQNRHLQPLQIVQTHIKHILQEKQVQDKLEAIQGKLKYYQFSKNLKIYQNQEIITTFFRLIIFQDHLKDSILNLRKIFHPHSSYNQYQHKTRNRNQSNQVFNDSLFLYPQRQDSSVDNCSRVSFSQQEQIADTIQQFSRISALYSQLSLRKKNIIKKVKKRELKYKNYIFLSGGMISLSLSYNLFDIQQFKTHKFQEIESLDIGGNNLKLEGIQVLTFMKWPNIKTLQIWRNNIQTLQGSGLQKMISLTSLSATFNPLKSDTVQYLLKHIWQKLEQFRIQFIDGNTSWPMLVKHITKPFPKLSRMRIGKQGFIGTSQPLSEKTMEQITQLQQYQIQVF